MRIPMCSFMAEQITLSHPMISFLFDLMFSTGIAEGLSMIMDRADERARPKLVWMSMNVARMLREGSNVTPSVQTLPAPNKALLSADGPGEPAAPAKESLPSPRLPHWQEAGEWNLFD